MRCPTRDTHALLRDARSSETHDGRHHVGSTMLRLVVQELLLLSRLRFVNQKFLGVRSTRRCHGASMSLRVQRVASCHWFSPMKSFRCLSIVGHGMAAALASSSAGETVVVTYQFVDLAASCRLLGFFCDVDRHD